MNIFIIFFQGSFLLRGFYYISYNWIVQLRFFMKFVNVFIWIFFLGEPCLAFLTLMLFFQIARKFSLEMPFHLRSVHECYTALVTIVLKLIEELPFFNWRTLKHTKNLPISSHKVFCTGRGVFYSFFVCLLECVLFGDVDLCLRFSPFIIGAENRMKIITNLGKKLSLY